MKKWLMFLMMVPMVFSLFFLPANPTEAALKKIDQYEERDVIAQIDPSKPFVPKTEEELKAIRSSNEDYVVELTTEQAIARKAELQGRTVEEVRAEFEAENFKNPQFLPLSTVCSWVEKTHTLAVKSYKPKLLIIPQFCRSGSAGWINTGKAPLMQEFIAASKSFNGTVAVDLQSSGYYYKVNGSFHNTSSVTHNGTVGVNAVFTATYSAGTSSNHYGTITTPLTYVKVGNS